MEKFPKAKKGKQSKSHEYAVYQERDLANKLGGHETKRSGAGDIKGDVRIKGKYRIECKCTKHKSYSITRELVEKIQEEALSTGEIPLFQIDFINEKGRKLQGIYIVPEGFIEL